MFVNSFLFVTKNCFLAKGGKVRIRIGKTEEQWDGGRTDEEMGKVRKITENRKEDGKNQNWS